MALFGMKPARLGVGGGVLLGAAFMLGACSLFSGDEGAPAAPGPPITGCEQQAQALGYQVIRVGPQTTDPGGNAVMPVLVNWGRNGGFHLICRQGPNGTVTLG